CGEGVEVLRELLCCGLAQLDTVRSCVHGMLLCGVVSPSRKRQGNFCPRTSRTPGVRRGGQRERRRSGRWQPSPARRCSALYWHRGLGKRCLTPCPFLPLVI